MAAGRSRLHRRRQAPTSQFLIQGPSPRFPNESGEAGRRRCVSGAACPGPTSRVGSAIFPRSNVGWRSAPLA
eukprot:12013158-Alexandrium_andersonii.AAC.1